MPYFLLQYFKSDSNTNLQWKPSFALFQHKPTNWARMFILHSEKTVPFKIIKTTCFHKKIEDNHLACCTGSGAEQPPKVKTTSLHKHPSLQENWYTHIDMNVCMSINMCWLTDQLGGTLSQPLPSEHAQGVAPSLTDPRRSRIGILVPNFSSRAVTADSSWCACFPKSCNPPS